MGSAHGPLGPWALGPMGPVILGLILTALSSKALKMDPSPDLPDLRDLVRDLLLGTSRPHAGGQAARVLKTNSLKEVQNPLAHFKGKNAGLLMKANIENASPAKPLALWGPMGPGKPAQC